MRVNIGIVFVLLSAVTDHAIHKIEAAPVELSAIFSQLAYRGQGILGSATTTTIASTSTETEVTTTVIPDAGSFAVDSIIATDVGLSNSTFKANGIPFGFLPDYQISVSQLTSYLEGIEPAAVGIYSQITSSSYSGSQLLQYLNQVNPGTVFIASIMPTAGFDIVTTSVAAQVAEVAKQFTDRGIEFWLRFGHEMNYYVTDGTYNGTPEEFIAAWKNISAAVADNDLVKMFWSPNIANVESLYKWWPGKTTVDIVGLDYYATSHNEAAVDVYLPFYKSFSAPYDIPFAIGETGYYSTSATPADKLFWLKSVTSSEMIKKMPNYVSCSWFEFQKQNTNFQIVNDPDTYSAVKDYLF